ncbi:MAG: cell division protein SepF [Actinomycetota bacterium]|nr:cell division protein SepF [Actinomycetota bacterium]
MSTLRKVGAFLGLIPDDARYDRAGHEYAELADGDYHEQGYHDGHGYGDGDGGFDDPNSEYLDHRGTGDYAAGSDGAESTDDHRRPVAYTGYSADRHHDTHDQSAAADDDYAYAGAASAAAPAEAFHPRQQSAAGGRPARRSSKRNKPADSSDYQVQGSLAVQPDVRPDAPAEIAGSSQKPVTITLTGFADARDVGESYRKGQAVILDMTDITDAEARRMVDFAAGLAFAVRGSIDKVTTKVFMLHPPESDGLAENGELAFASR